MDIKNDIKATLVINSVHAGVTTGWKELTNVMSKGEKPTPDQICGMLTHFVLDALNNVIDFGEMPAQPQQEQPTEQSDAQQPS